MKECEHKTVWRFDFSGRRTTSLHICTDCNCYVKHERHTKKWIVEHKCSENKSTNILIRIPLETGWKRI